MAEIIIHVQVDSLPFDRDRCEELVRKLFRKRPNVREVTVTALPGGHAGLSALSILLARPVGPGGSNQNPLLIRIGRLAAIQEENRRYKTFVEPAIGHQRAELRDLTDDGELAIVAYDYLRLAASNQPLQTLRDVLGGSDPIEPIIEAIQLLVDETLTQGEMRSGWYANEPTPDQRAIWFYNTLLPSAITLTGVSSATVVSDTDLTAILGQADSPGSALLIGRRVTIGAGGRYQRLAIVEREPGRLRLFLYEAAPPPEEPFQPMPQVAARIDLFLPEADEPLPEALAAALARADGEITEPLAGEIVETRRHQLQLVIQTGIGPVARALPDGRISVGALQLPNPLTVYAHLLSTPRTLTTAIVHGDFNLGNILLSWSRDRLHITPWLIDFDKTGPGQHAVFDAVKLEIEYKTHILAHYLTVEDLLVLEDALFQALNDPQAEPDLQGKPNLVRAYRFLAAVRRSVLVTLHPRIAPTEYYLGLLGYGLVVLKYKNLYPETRRGWLTEQPLLGVPAQAAYLSAAYAASRIAQCEALAVTTETYRDLAAERTLIRSPRLVERNTVVTYARRQLRDERPAVELWGAPASGRGAVAELLLAELEGQGYVVWPWPAQFFATAEEFVRALLPVLQRLAGQQPIGWPYLGSSDLADRQSLLQTGFEAIIKLLEPPFTRTMPRVALLLRLDLADEELRAFAVRLSWLIRRTALVVIAERPLEDFAGSSHEITPLSLAGVQAYVDREQIPLDPAMINQFFTACMGLPDLMVRMATMARAEIRDWHDPNAQQIWERILNTSQGAFFTYTLSQLTKPLASVLLVETLLVNLDPAAPDYLDDLVDWLVNTRQIPDCAESGEDLLDRYRQHSLQNHDGLMAHLRAQVLKRCPVKEQRRYHDLFAEFFMSHADVAVNPVGYPRFLEARARISRHQIGLVDKHVGARTRWDSQAVEQTAAALIALGAVPELFFSSKTPEICTMIRIVLKEGGSLHDQLQLYELLGDGNAYLGRFQDAAEAYSKIWARSQRSDPRLLVRALRAYQAINLVDQEVLVAKRLHDQVALDQPLAALWYTHLARRDPAHTIDHLSTAIQILEASRATWGNDRDYYTDELVRVYNQRAYAYFLRGAVDRGVSDLKQLRDRIADGQLGRVAPSLQARLNNDLGCFYSYEPYQADDPRQAQALFQEALDQRVRIGDLPGSITTVQNLCNVEINLADTAEAWATACARFQEYIPKALSIQHSQGPLIIANYIDAQISIGEFEPAAEAFALVEQTKVDSYTWTVMLINQARCAIWSGNYDLGNTSLEEASSLIADDPDSTDTDRLDWVLLALEGKLRLDWPWRSEIDDWLAAIDPQKPQSLRARADLSLAYGLRQLSRAQAAAAQGSARLRYQRMLDARQFLQQSFDDWNTLRFPYRTGLVACWQAEAAFWARDGAQTRAHIAQAHTRLAPLHARPALGWLQSIEDRLNASEGFLV